MRTVFLSAILTILLVTSASAQATTLIASHKDWSVYVHEGNGDKVCFAASAPKDTEPKGVNRSSIYFYLTNWPKDGIKNEISVKIGYPLKADSSPKVSVGADVFEMFVRDDKAFLRDPEDERKLLAAMKKGSTMVVTGVSQRGTQTTDKYSLFGVSAAIAELNKACP